MKEPTKQKLLRAPESLIEKVKVAAAKGRRSENQEMLLRIELSFDPRIEAIIRELTQ